MKIKANILGNIMCWAIHQSMDEGVSSTRYGDIDMDSFEQAEMALSIKRQLAEKKKRITIDVVYPKD